MKNIVFILLLLFVVSCNRMASFADILQLYADTFNEQAKLENITDSNGIKIIHYVIHYNRPLMPMENIFTRATTDIRGLTIQKCLLPSQNEKFNSVRFKYEFLDGTIVQDFNFFKPDSLKKSISDKASLFFGSIGYSCYTYLGKKDHRKIHFMVNSFAPIENDLLKRKSIRRAQFVRFYVISDSSKYFDWMFFQNGPVYHTGTIVDSSKIPLFFLYRVNDRSLFEY